MSTQSGSTAVQEQPKRLVFTPGQGWRTIRRWKGPTTAIEAQSTILAAQGYSVDLDYGVGNVSRLEASIGLNAQNGEFEQPQETWSLFSNRHDKDLLETNNAAVTGISDTDKSTIRKHIQSPEEGVSPSLTGNALEAYLLMKHGMRTIRVDQPIIRGTYLATANYTAQVSTDNVGKVFTNAQLSSIAGVPSNLLIQLPSSSQTSSFDGTGDLPEARFGWLKSYPTAELVGPDQFRVSVEFEYGLWPDLVYADAS